MLPCLVASARGKGRSMSVRCKCDSMSRHVHEQAPRRPRPMQLGWREPLVLAEKTCEPPVDSPCHYLLHSRRSTLVPLQPLPSIFLQYLYLVLVYVVPKHPPMLQKLRRVRPVACECDPAQPHVPPCDQDIFRTSSSPHSGQFEIILESQFTDLPIDQGQRKCIYDRRDVRG